MDEQEEEQLMNSQTIAELRSYKGTVLEEAANEAIAFADKFDVNFATDAEIVDAFEVCETFSYRLYQETGLLIGHSKFGAYPFDISMYVVGANGMNNIGVGSRSLGQYFTEESYRENSDYIVNWIIKFIQIRMKEQMQKQGRNFDFDSFINNDAINYIADESIGDEAQIIDLLSTRLLPTYKRNRNNYKWG